MPESVLHLYYGISAFLFYAITKEAMSVFFRKRDMLVFVEVIAWILFIITDSVVAIAVENSAMLIFVQIMYSIVFCILLYTGSLRNRIIWVIMINLIGMIAEAMVGSILLILGYQLEQIGAFGSLVSKVIVLTIFVALKVGNRYKLRKDIPFRYWLVICLIPIGSIFILHTIFTLSQKSNDSVEYGAALIVSAILMMINFIIFRVYESLVDYIDVQKQKVAYKKQVELYKNQIRIQAENNAKILKIKHDINNHLVCLQEFLLHGNYENAEKYIEGILNDGKLYGAEHFISSGNAVIDALLNYKFKKARDNDIILDTHIEIPEKIAINNTDLSVIIGNCVDNSIEATSRINEDREKKIRIEIIYRKAVLLIKLSNPYQGKLRRDREGDFITTKKEDMRNHGMGLHSVFRVIEKYNGDYRISTENGMFSIQIMLYT